MKKILLRYLIFLLPGVLIALLFNNRGMASQILQWVAAALLIVGWSVNTGLAAYRYPRSVLSLLLVYAGLHLLLITIMYRSYGQTYVILSRWGGILSFLPLDILVNALLDFNIPQELYVTGILVSCCLIGWIIGFVYRFIRPNPYRPVMRSRVRF